MAKTAKKPGGGATFIQRSRNLRPSEKALFHDELGAGRSHVKREFFSLNTEDETAIMNRIDQALSKAVEK